MRLRTTVRFGPLKWDNLPPFCVFIVWTPSDETSKFEL